MGLASQAADAIGSVWGGHSAKAGAAKAKQGAEDFAQMLTGQGVDLAAATHAPLQSQLLASASGSAGSLINRIA